MPPQMYGAPIVPVNYGIARGNRQLMYSPMQMQMQQLRAARAGGIPFRGSGIQSRAALMGVPMTPIIARQAQFGMAVPNPYLVTGAVGRNGYNPAYGGLEGNNLGNNPIPAKEDGFNFTVGFQTDGKGGMNTAFRPVDSLPDFIADASNETIDEFKRIIRQSNATYDQKLEQIGGLVKDLDETAQERFRLFKIASPTTTKAPETATSHPPTPISTKASGARRRKPVSSFTVPSSFDEITEIANDQTLPEKERWRRIVAIYTELEPSTLNEYEVRFEDMK
uniref:MAT1 domain-containing protein n=1 Tax=Panagrellus redivivus TaxID=6233 RepID=A0A7E4W8Q7_PANRE